MDLLTVEGHMEKNSSLNFMSSVGFQASKIRMFLGKFTAELVWKSFSGRNDAIETPNFRFSNSLLYGLEEYKELRILRSWVLG